MNSKAMLNAYPDSLGGSLGAAADLLARPELQGAFGSFYILPSVFDSDLDRGFSIISYDLNRRLASEADLARLRALGLDLKLDFVLNHLSVLSPQFQDILRRGDASPYRDFFIDWNAFWQGHGRMTPQGYIQPDPSAMKDMFLRKPGLPLLMVRLPDGREVPYWNTFYQEVRYAPLEEQALMAALPLQYGEAHALAERVNPALQAGTPPEQIDFGDLSAFREDVLALLSRSRRYLGQMDLNLGSPLVWDFYRYTLGRLAGYGASIVRLDAFAYAPKAPGRRNFLNEPETWDVLARIDAMAKPLGLSLLPEIHAAYGEHSYEGIARRGYMTYDFFLPGLVIDALENHDGSALASWAQEIQDKGLRTVSMLGCHDGIPMLDLKGLIPEARIQALIDLIVSRGGLIKNLHGQKNVYYQVNATYFSALGEDERKLILARALQMFMPGKPQVWYLDLFAGKNDLAAVARGGEAGHKEINRTNLTGEQIRRALGSGVVARQLELLRLRNACPAFGFDAHLTVDIPRPGTLRLLWQRDGATAELTADLVRYTGRIRTSGWAQAGELEL